MSTSLTGPETAPPPLAPAAAAGPKPPKNPWLAALFSFFPGLGQVYNGQVARALVFFSAWAGSIYATAEINPLPFALFIPFVHLYNIVDAWRGASLINARVAGGVAEAEEDVAESPAWGGALVAIGLVFLLNNLGWLELAALRRYWPLLLVAAGVALIHASMRKRKAAQKGDASGV
jgi:hypothetical protein